MKTAYKTFPISSVTTDPATNEKYTSYYEVFTVGAGYLDVAAALASQDLALATVGCAASPGVSYDATTGQATLLTGSNVLWGGSCWCTLGRGDAGAGYQ
jgi:serine protease AprX